MRYLYPLVTAALLHGGAVGCSKNDSRPDDSSSSGGEASSSGSGGQPVATGGSAQGGQPSESGGAPAQAGASGGEGMGGQPANATDFVPSELTIIKFDGAETGLNVVAATTELRDMGPVMFLAIRNDGTVGACDASVTVEFFTEDDQTLGAFVEGLRVARFFRRSDDVDGALACLQPGETALVSFDELPADLTIDLSGTAVYRFNFFRQDILPFDLTPLDDLRIEDVQSITNAEGTAYSGKVQNTAEATFVDPTVTLFSLTSAGRPIDAVNIALDHDLEPGAEETFETPPLVHVGTSHAAFLGGRLEY